MQKIFVKVAHDELADRSIYRFAVTKDAMIGFRDCPPVVIDFEDGNDVIGVVFSGDKIDDEWLVSVESESGGGEHRAFHTLGLAMMENRSGRSARFVGADNAEFKSVQEILNSGRGGERLEDSLLFFGPSTFHDAMDSRRCMFLTFVRNCCTPRRRIQMGFFLEMVVKKMAL